MRWVLYIIRRAAVPDGQRLDLARHWSLPGRRDGIPDQVAYIGIVMDLVGIGLIVLASRRRKNSRPLQKPDIGIPKKATSSKCWSLFYCFHKS